MNTSKLYAVLFIENDIWYDSIKSFVHMIVLNHELRTRFYFKYSLNLVKGSEGVAFCQW